MYKRARCLGRELRIRECWRVLCLHAGGRCSGPESEIKQSGCVEADYAASNGPSSSLITVILLMMACVLEVTVPRTL